MSKPIDITQALADEVTALNFRTERFISSAGAQDAQEAAVGDVVRVVAFGASRLAKVVSVARTGSVTVIYTTPSSAGRIYTRTYQPGRFTVVAL